VTELALAEAVPLAHALVSRVAEDLGVRCLFIKGPAAVLQGLRSRRTSVDVDALIDPVGLEKLRARLTELGWVDEHPYSTPTATDYSRTHRHRAWPCELDLHTSFLGLYADRQAVFEELWERRSTVDVAGRAVACPDPSGHALVLALNSLRDPHDRAKASELAELAERMRASLDVEGRADLGRLAGRLGAADTAGPFLEEVGAPNEGLGSTAVPDLAAWRVRTQPSWRMATWLADLWRQPKRSVPGYLWRAVVLSEAEMRVAHPELPPGRRALARARYRRLRRGLAAAPSAWRTVRAARAASDRPHPEGVVEGGGTLGTALGVLDRGLPWKRGIVLYTFPDFDDQGLAMCTALAARAEPISWLCRSGDAAQLRALEPGLADRVRVLPVRSPRGAWAYVRARTVIHTHGLYRQPARSNRKYFVNLWHGMPVKRLTAEPRLAERQTDALTVTSEVHAIHLADAWGLDAAAIHQTGLPRNDRMLRAAQRERPEAVAALAGRRPLVVWLPTYRQSVVGDIRRDGTEFGNPFQMPNATVSGVMELAEQLGVHVVVKLHPMAPSQDIGEYGALSMWDEDALAAHHLTLYELLGHADVLITDHSSVWVDFLMLDRPLIFSIADLETYAASRGHYFQPLADHLPGPLVTDLTELGNCLQETLTEPDAAERWAGVRARLLAVHHRWVDDGSAARVASLVR
jgi:CDP-glycerol glycerophosphotransferase (TagB/SpsB family)